MSLIVKSFGNEYELVRAGASPLSSCRELYVLRDHAFARQFISYVDVSPEAWRGLLMSLGVSIPSNFNHASDIVDALARSCVHGDFSFYKLIKIEKLKAIPCGKGMGIVFVKGPKPHSNTNANLVDIGSADATDLIELIPRYTLATGKAKRPCPKVRIWPLVMSSFKNMIQLKFDEKSVTCRQSPTAKIHLLA